MTAFDPELSSHTIAAVPRHRSFAGRPSSTILIGNALRRWRTFVVLLVVLSAGSAYAITMMNRGYTAEAVVVLDPRRNQMLDGLAAFGALQLDTAAMNTETSLFTLPTLILRVVRKLGLATEPAEDAAIPAIATSLRALFGHPSMPEAVVVAPSSPDDRVDDGPTAREARAVDRFLRQLDVVNDARSYTIRVRYSAADPVLAAAGANTVAEFEIAAQREARMRSVREAAAWLNDEIVALQDRVGRAENDEQAFRRDHGLGDGKTVSTAQQEVNAYAQEVTLAGAASSQAQARMLHAKTGVVAGLEEDVRISAEREANVRRDLEKARARLGAVQAAEAAVQPIAREASASRALLEDLMRRSRNADSQVSAQRPEARLVSRALVPTRQAGWGPARLVPIAVAVSATVASMLVVLLAFLEKGFRSVSALESLVDAEVIGETPHVADGVQAVCRLIDDEPTSAASESARSIVSRIVSPAKACCVVQIASPGPMDGKSMLAITIAKAAGRAGRKCLLIDADFRGPTSHATLGLPREPGLFDLLAKRSALDRVLHRGAAGSFDYIASGAVSDDPLKVLLSGAVEQHLVPLRKRYDLIIIDSAPLSSVCDGTLLAAQVDAVILSVRWRVTRAEAVRKALDALSKFARRTPSIVLTQVGRRRTGRRGPTVPDTYRAWSPMEAQTQKRSPAMSRRVNGAAPERGGMPVRAVEAMPVEKDASS